jgi:uroporphyrinogen-III synthase
MKSKVVAILETRTGAHLAELLARRGAIPMSAPALEEVPDVAPDAVPALLRDWRQRPFALAVFQTGVGTKALFAAADASGALDELLSLLGATRVAVRGPKPVGELNARGVRIDVRAPSPFTTQELVAALSGMALSNTRVLVQRYGAANPALRAALTAQGAEVHEIATYRWAVPADVTPLRELLSALRLGRVDAAVFTSAVQMDNLMTVAHREGCGAELPGWLNAVTVASVGPVCSRTLAAHGVRVSLEASPPKLGPLLTALEAALGAAP